MANECDDDAAAGVSMSNGVRRTKLDTLVTMCVVGLVYMTHQFGGSDALAKCRRILPICDSGHRVRWKYGCTEPNRAVLSMYENG